MSRIDWRSMTKNLTSMTEIELANLLAVEMETHKRPAIARRLHQRYSILRTMRERADLMARLGA